MTDPNDLKEALRRLGPAFARDLLDASTSRAGRRAWERRPIPRLEGKAKVMGKQDAMFWTVMPRLAREILDDYAVTTDSEPSRPRPNHNASG